ncbi:bifunctional hydroxymethylpyrimidine kinase/phosphomethylpyrimidine kinase [Kocuria massiliensis]|uniref:bifunctional hydroxymethylpyrimidine kinase/phosphomethylpyrimidine kinase n=1 Tax=Kocuria massiliensis TaxID=1926282 RepID=UPI000A1C92E0|nr:bifunctional hydroxymethylpyrimidine kinase/phosphomethylpyrimidine kinase [Kocuria massiliensis]
MRPPIALSIAGSDPSGGAGTLADLKTFAAVGAYGCACTTSLTSQNTLGVQSVHGIDAEVVVSQVESVIDDLPVDATKIGMLGSAETVRHLARMIASRRRDFGVVVLDPVMVATSGDPLLAPDADAALRDELVPLADVITPNLPEGARLLGRPDDVATSLAAVREQAIELLALGPRAILLKGGHLADAQAVDVLAMNPSWAPGGRARVSEPVIREFTSPRIETRNTHGTGCTLSSAIAAYAARHAMPVDPRTASGLEEAAPNVESSGADTVPEQSDALRPVDDDALVEAVRRAKTYLTRALREGAGWEISRTPDRGHGPVNHFAPEI